MSEEHISSVLKRTGTQNEYLQNYIHKHSTQILGGPWHGSNMCIEKREYGMQAGPSISQPWQLIGPVWRSMGSGGKNKMQKTDA